MIFRHYQQLSSCQRAGWETRLFNSMQFTQNKFGTAMQILHLQVHARILSVVALNGAAIDGNMPTRNLTPDSQVTTDCPKKCPRFNGSESVMNLSFTRTTSASPLKRNKSVVKVGVDDGKELPGTPQQEEAVIELVVKSPTPAAARVQNLDEGTGKVCIRSQFCIANAF